MAIFTVDVKNDEVKTEQSRNGHADHICPPSVAKWLNSPVRTIFENPRRILRGLIREGQVAVDLGCGGGVFSAELARQVGRSGRVYAVDVQPEMLELTKKYLAKRKLLERVTLHQCQSQDIDLQDVEADLVIAIHMVHETPDPEALIRQASALLKPGGHLLVLEPKGHATPEQIAETIAFAKANGLKMVRELKSMGGSGGLFVKT